MQITIAQRIGYFTQGLGLKIILSFMPPIITAWAFFLLYLSTLKDGEFHLVLGLGLAGIAIGSVIVVTLILSTIPPLRRMIYTTGRLAHGDLSVEIGDLDRKDETGELARALEVFRANALERRELSSHREAEEARVLRRAQSVMALADIFEQTVGNKVVEVEKAAVGISKIAERVTDRSSQSGGRSMEASESASLSSEKAAEVSEATQQLAESVREISHRVDESSAISRQAVGKVGDVTRQMDELSATAEGIGGVVQLINDIAAQTNLLALNATIEAARAGDAGKGFAVVASEVKNLANQTARATEDIARRISAVQESARTAAASITDVVHIITSIEESSAAIAGAVQEQEATTSHIAASINEVSSKAEVMLSNILSLCESSARGCSGTIRVLWSSKALSSVVKELGKEAEEFINRVRNADEMAEENDVYYRAAMETAAEISVRFERALDAGEISLADLFDEAYTPISGTNPQQVLTKFTGLTDRLLPDLLEKALELGGRIVFCCAIDRNGYIPTHNKKVSQPQGSDPRWNDANCRNRRMFTDKTGLQAGQNTTPLLIQSYRRKLSDGEYQMMIDASAPIVVKGRHWGGLRVGFKS